MATIYLPSEQDAEVLRLIVRSYKSLLKNGARREPAQLLAELSIQTPEVHIALIPEDGIPALTTVGTAEDAPKQPGFALCTIYTIVQTGEEEYELKERLIEKLVFNITGTSLSAGFCLVVKDKFGKWLAVAGSGGGIVCKANSEISARVDDTLGSGLCTVYDFDELGVLTPTEEEVMCYNSVAAAIPGGVYLQAKVARNGRYLIDVQDCDPEE